MTNPSTQEGLSHYELLCATLLVADGTPRSLYHLWKTALSKFPSAVTGPVDRSTLARAIRSLVRRGLAVEIKAEGTGVGRGNVKARYKVPDQEGQDPNWEQQWPKWLDDALVVQAGGTGREHYGRDLEWFGDQLMAAHLICEDLPARLVEVRCKMLRTLISEDLAEKIAEQHRPDISGLVAETRKARAQSELLALQSWKRFRWSLGA